jgi:hypothetical protein
LSKEQIAFLEAVKKGENPKLPRLRWSKRFEDALAGIRERALKTARGERFRTSCEKHDEKGRER